MSVTTRGVLILCLVFVCVLISVDGLGVNWGTIATHKLPGKTVVQMLKDNGIKKVKLFDSDESSLKALGGSGIEVMVAIPNGEIENMNSYDKAKEWVKSTIMDHGYNGGANITYVAVGNEPFLEAYNGTYLNTTFPALKNIQTALNDAGVGTTIKATVPFNADVYDSPSLNPIPSAGRFRSDITKQMSQILKLLDQNNSPFMVNIYPYLSLHYGNSEFPVDYAFFEGSNKPVDDNGVIYSDVFDANYDTCVAALKALGFGNMTVMVGEMGWPTDGDKFANTEFASRFYKGLLKKLGGNKGTPLRPGYIEVYLFGLLDEDAKSVLPGNFERHWGIFTYDGQAKFPMDLSGQGLANKSLVPAQGVEYQPKKWCQLNPKAKDLSKVQDHIKTACEAADCTSLGYGCSCNGLDEKGNASYAFNSYFQANNQKDSSCDFDGLATITTQNISQGNCNFTIQLVGSSGQPPVASPAWSSVVASPLLSLLAILVGL